MKTWERTFLAIFGTFLLAVGTYAVFLGNAPPVWRYVGGIVLCVLGINSFYGAVANKRPWISKIGPLP